MEWRDDAACRTADPAWFDDQGKGVSPVRAMRVCRGCPVRRDCLDFALELEAADAQATAGVWGGTTAKARMDLRRGLTSVVEAMARGDAIADKALPEERVARDEPWLDADVSVPVAVHRREVSV